MMIVDGQIHIWGEYTPERPWLGDAWKNHQPGAMNAAMIIAEMDKAGVDRAVLVPPSWEGERRDVSLAAVAAYPDRFAIMGRLPLIGPVDQQLLDHWTEQPGMLGLRYTFTTDKDVQTFLDGGVNWLWSAAERANLPLMLLPRSTLVSRFGAIAARYPGLKIIIDHLARETVGPKDEAAFADLGDVLALAAYPNVAVKISALPTYSTEAYPFPGLHKYIRQVYDAFGPKRMFWGSDLTRLRCSYRECIDLFMVELPWLSAADKELIMGRSLCDWLGWADGPQTAD